MTIAFESPGANLAALKSALYSHGMREPLGAARTYYVRTDGSDANTGLANSAGGAFLTIQKALAVVQDTVNPGSYKVTIQVGNGTYTGPIYLNAIAGLNDNYRDTTSNNYPILRGDPTTPSNVTITRADAVEDNAAGIYAVGAGSKWILDGIKWQSTGSGSCHGLLVSHQASVLLGDVEIGASTGIQIFAQALAVVEDVLHSDWIVSGGAQAFLFAGNNSLIDAEPDSITFTGTPDFSFFCACARLGGIIQSGATIVGSATGQRYFAATNGIIDSGGNGEDYFPGDTPGTTATGGRYLA